MRKYDVITESAKVVGSGVEDEDNWGFLKVEATLLVEFTIHDGECRDCGWSVADMKADPIVHFRHCYESTRLV